MNSFDKDAQERAEERNQSGIVSTWVAFRDSLKEVIESYNRSPRGERHPAYIFDESDKRIIINCAKGTLKELTTLMITVRAVMVDSELTIACEIEQWRQTLSNIRYSDRLEKVPFVFDPKTRSLLFRTEVLRPEDAADKLLRMALLS